MRKLIISILALSITVIALILLGIFTGIIKVTPIKQAESASHKLVLQKIENIGELELVRYNFNDVSEETIKRKLFDIDNLAPDSKVLLIINGEAAACVNLKDVKSPDIHSDDDNLYIELPPPTICYAKVNHNRSKIYDANFTARLLNPELIDEAYKNAETKIKDEAVKLGILNKARVNAKKMLSALLGGVTDKSVVIQFKDSLNTN